MNIKKTVCTVVYYFFARHLPASDSPYSLGAKRIRRALCKIIFEVTGEDFNIEHGAFFGSGKDIFIGSRSGLGLNCRVQGPLNIGNNVMMGPDVIIYTGNHRFDRLDVPMIQQGNTEPRAVVIEDDVWIAARAIILPGITVGKGAVVAAGAVVTKDVAPYTVVGGVPARLIKSRNKDEEKL